MTVLLDLSPEIVSLVVHYLAPYSEALDNLCLAGNHNLLALVRPYTWREIHVTVGDGRRTNTANSEAFADRWRTFCSDSTKAAAVRSLNITLSGLFDFDTPAVNAIYHSFPRLLNVTHASICLIDSIDIDSSERVLIKAAVKALPTLISLSVNCCTDDYDEEYDNMDDCSTPKLVHLATRFCNPMGIGCLWQYCSNLRGVEMQGGLVENFWRENAKDISNGFIGYTFSTTRGVHLLDDPKFKDLSKINLVSTAPCGDTDASVLAGYFEQRTGGHPGPSRSGNSSRVLIAGVTSEQKFSFG
ncbi:hypothetical protein DFH06DRAFT_561285 [Mycena polygramma]|nr:hypothetical protein DFH06DRAFT_561285 [Mycena polygramma]